MDITSSLTEQLPAILLKKKIPRWGTLQDKMSDLLFWRKGSGKPIASFPTLSAHPQASISKEIWIPRPTSLSLLCIPPHFQLLAFSFFCSSWAWVERLRLKGWLMQFTEQGVLLPLCPVPTLLDEANQEIPYSKRLCSRGCSPHQDTKKQDAQASGNRELGNVA